MWDLASSAHHRFAALFDIRFLVILEEFQNITQYIYPDQQYQTSPIETLAGSFHSLSESKLAPMFIGKYLEAGLLKRMRLSPYFTEISSLNI